MKKHFGFMDGELARSKSQEGGFGVMAFGGDCIRHYTFWQRLRLAILLLAKCNICDLHVPLSPKCEWSTPAWCKNWVRENRNPTVCKAFEIGASIRDENFCDKNSKNTNQGSESARDSVGPADSEK